MAKKETAQSGSDNTHICAILAYFLAGIVWYFVDENMKKSDFVKFHVKQGIILLIVSIIVSVANAILAWIPIIGWLISIALSITLFVLWIIGLISAINKTEKEVPIIGQFVKKLTF